MSGDPEPGGEEVREQSEGKDALVLALNPDLITSASTVIDAFNAGPV